MNERIKELAEQAGIEFDDSFSLEPETIYYLKLSDFEKFAELIVQEVCWDMMNSHVDKTKINRVAKSWGVDVGVKE